ncbi:MAG: hypothetical protein ABIP56_00265 [Dokdonella sp.]
MTRSILFRGFLLLALALMAGCESAPPQRDLDVQRLERSLDQLANDRRFGQLATAELDRARGAVQALRISNSRGPDALSEIYVAERKVDTAWAAAQARDMENQRQQVNQEHSELLVRAARRDATNARRELERQRLLGQIQAEESAQIAQDAEQARLESERSAADAEAARNVATQQKKIAVAQARAAALSKKEAELTAAAAKSKAKAKAKSKVGGK